MGKTYHRGKTPNQGLVANEKSMGSPFDVPIGKSFYVEMRNPGSGGYQIKEPEFDQNILQMREKKSIPPPENTKRAGDFGRVIYIFKAIATGSTDVVFRIYRTWEDNVPAKEYVRVKVVVTQ
jgi:predicted secreted protein